MPSDSPNIAVSVPENQKNPIEDMELGRLGGTTPAHDAPNALARLRARARGSGTSPRERDVEQALIAAVKAAGGLCWKFTSPGTDGVPDRLVILPGAIGFIEVKAPGQSPRPLQCRRLAQLAALGIPALVLDHPDDVQGVLDAIRAA